MNEMRNCPFCGEKAELIKHKCVSNGFVGYYVWHSSFKCRIREIRTRIVETPEEAIADWNRRVENG